MIYDILYLGSPLGVLGPILLKKLNNFLITRPILDFRVSLRPKTLSLTHKIYIKDTVSIISILPSGVVIGSMPDLKNYNHLIYFESAIKFN